MATANEVILDKSTLHEVRLERLKNNIVRRMISVLNKSDAAIVDELNKKLATMSPEQFTVRRLDKLLESVRELNTEAYSALKNELDTEISDFVKYEVGFQESLFKDTLPVQITVASVNAEQVYAAALARPFQGKLLREWMQGLETDKAVRIRDTIRTGYVNNETIQQMVTRLRGTKSNNYADGILDINKRNAETVVRTAIGHMAAYTRNQFFEQNDDLIKAIKWVSTLDSRTTPPCIARDGKLYTNGTHRPIGHSLPWGGGAGAFHFGCRSTSIPVIKSFRELGFDVDDLPATTRASLNGQVPADTTYAEWLGKQSASIQDEVLGKTRGKLFRDGGIKIDRFINNKSEFITLDELRKLDAEAFKKAGL